MQEDVSVGLKSYLLNLAAALTLVMVVNGFIFLANRGEEGSHTNVPMAPPGYVIGIVWIALFVAMSTSRWLALRAQDHTTARAIVGLIVLCALYPVYTQALANLRIGLYGNIATGLVALVIAAMACRRSRLAAGLLMLVVCWLGFASYIILEQMKWSPS